MKGFLKWMTLLLLALLSLSPRAAARGVGQFAAGSHLLGVNFEFNLGAKAQPALTYDYGLTSFGTNGNWTFGLGPYLGSNLRWATLGARASIQGYLAERTTVYGGLLLGVRLPYVYDRWWRARMPWPGTLVVPAGDLYAGMRYMFSDHWGINVECSPALLLWFSAYFRISAGLSCRI